MKSRIPIVTLIVVCVQLFHPAAHAAPSYALENVTDLYTTVTDEAVYTKAWSYDGLKVAFTVLSQAPGHVGESTLYISDLRSPGVAAQLLGFAANIESGTALGWSADDAYVYFTQKQPSDPFSRVISKVRVSDGQLTAGVLRRSDVVPGAIDGRVQLQDVRCTEDPPLMAISVNAGSSTPMAFGMLVQLDLQGTPVPGAHNTVIDMQTLGPARQIRVSPIRNRMLFVASSGPTVSQISLIELGLGDVHLMDPPVSNWSDPRLRAVEFGPDYGTEPSWSEDGKLVFHTEDFTGLYDENFATLSVTDFDIVVTRTSTIIIGAPEPNRLALPGNQGVTAASHGGTRFAYSDISPPNPSKLVAATLRVSDQINLDGASICQADFTLNDGAGTKLFIPAGTTCTNLGTGLQTISVYTPVSPVDEAQLAIGTSGVPVVREFEPSGVLFSPGVDLAVSYTDAEIRGLAETDLQVFKFNTATGKYDIPLPVTDREMDRNRIWVTITSFSTFGIAGKADSDGDGLSDDFETSAGLLPNDSDTDNDGLSDGFEVGYDGNSGTYNPYNPSTNPTGTDLDATSTDTDGDGVSDAIEIGTSHNPLNPGDFPSVSASSMPSLVLLAGVLLVTGLWMVRSRVRVVVPGCDVRV